MMQTTCPSCGAQISFKAKSSVMGVCQYCHSLLLRADAKLEEVGKVADLLDLKTPLYSGITGNYQGVNFQITGRTQIRHELGGIWTEWYAYFADGRWGWITEAQGRFYVTFVRQVDRLPDFNSLVVGQPATGLSLPVRLVVAEKGIAEYLGAEGEIPFYFTPGERYYYADLSGQQSEFATIDYSEQQPLIFIGRMVSLADLGVHPQTPVSSAAMADLPAQQVAVEKLNCPNCGGPLELRAPDQTERIACPYCGSLLDVNQGKLKFIKALAKPQNPFIPLGAVAEFDGEPMTVVGYMMRSTVVDRVEYLWEEFLLYNPKVGFGWLVRADDHWVYARSAPPGEITEGFKQATYKGKTYKLFNLNPAKVVCVMGEFYWKVEVGETTMASDYVRAGEMLSKEVSSTSSGTGEVNWSHGYYVYPDEIAKKFQIEQIPTPAKPGPCEPFKHQYIFKYWGLSLLILFLAGIFFAITSSNYLVYNTTLNLQPLANNSTATQVFFSEQFSLSPRRNVCIIATSPVDNSWVYFEGDLINEDTGLVQAFSAPIEYYHGVTDGESWKEGAQTTEVYVSSLPEGRYTLRIEAQWEKWQQPTKLSIEIVQGRARFVYFALALAFVSLVPIVVLFMKISFENRKWQESAFGPNN